MRHYAEIGMHVLFLSFPLSDQTPTFLVHDDQCLNTEVLSYSLPSVSLL